MSRFADRILARGVVGSGEIAGSILKNLRSCPIFFLEKSLTEMAFESYLFPEEYTTLTSPYDQVFMEYIPPRDLRWSVSAMGTIINCVKAGTPEFDLLSGIWAKAAGRALPLYTHWIISFIPIAEIDRRAAMSTMVVLCLLDGGGRLMLVDPDVRKGVWAMALPVDNQVSCDGFDGDKMFNSLIPFFFSLNLIHCKNIATRQIVPENKVQNKRRKRNLLPLLDYHVLEIKTSSQDTPPLTARSASPSPRRLHFCRGHFAHYGDGRGKLFGKYEGTFWVPAHVRGDKKKGLIVKDYALNPSKEIKP